MNTEMPDLLLHLFFGITGLLIAVEIVRTKAWKTFTPSEFFSGWKPFLFSIVPTTACLLAGKFGEIDTFDAAPYFAGSALVSFILTKLGLTTVVRSMILSVASVCLSMAVYDGYAQPVLGCIAGFLVWKLVENFVSKSGCRVDDVLAPVVWLSTFYFANLNLEGGNSVLCQNLVISALLFANCIRCLQPLLLKSDKFYIKRILLSVTGGLGMQLIASKVLLSSELTTTSVLCGVGFLSAYLFQTFDRHKDQGPRLPQALTNVMLAGVLMLGATRMFGMEGLLLLAASTTIAELTGGAFITGLFFVSRVLMQSYIMQFDTNVTGINLMHNYASASLYAGFLLAAAASLVLRHVDKKSVLSMVYLAGLMIVPGAANYLLHAEPTSAFLVSLGVASVMVTMLAPAFYSERSVEQENMIMIPVIVNTLTLLSNSLLALGDDASTQQRMYVVAGIGAVILVLGLIYRFGLSGGKPGASAPPAVAIPDASSC